MAIISIVFYEYPKNGIHVGDTQKMFTWAKENKAIYTPEQLVERINNKELADRQYPLNFYCMHLTEPEKISN